LHTFNRAVKDERKAHSKTCILTSWWESKFCICAPF